MPGQCDALPRYCARDDIYPIHIQGVGHLEKLFLRADPFEAFKGILEGRNKITPGRVLSKQATGCNLLRSDTRIIAKPANGCRKSSSRRSCGRRGVNSMPTRNRLGCGRIDACTFSTVPPSPCLTPMRIRKPIPSRPSKNPVWDFR